MTGPVVPSIPEAAIVEVEDSVAACEIPIEDQVETLGEEEEGFGLFAVDSDLWLYRDRTTAMLRRYLRFSIEVGRLPSLLGREFFRTRVTSYRVGTFEDAVIFVHDVEKCLRQLDDFEKKLIARVVFQDYTRDEAAHLIGCERRTVGRRFAETIDRLSDIFLSGGLLARLPVQKILPPESCQEGKTSENELSDS